MHITSLDQIEKTVPEMPGAKAVCKQVPLSREHGAPTFSFRVFTIEPGGHTPLHRHPYEHMNYVITGQGILVSEDGELSVREGDFALVLPGENHQYRNSSSGRDLVMICAVPIEHE
ncbi:MAG: cupin domain-containing protein [Dehalococcoidia bacterium]|nr:cupin domain-containing protein [Dehalococcoidia bacterium]